MIYPLKKYIVTQKFGETITDPKGHTGIDLYQPIGTPVYAAEGGDILAAGVINNAYGNSAYGNCILIDHKNGYYTFYAHLSTVKVKVGMSIIQGAVIGTVGATGNVTGPHLHFEIRNNPLWNRKNFIDPESILGSADSETIVISKPSEVNLVDNNNNNNNEGEFQIGENVKISGSLVNMRNEAGYNGKIITELKNGVQLKIVGIKETKDGLDWYPVQLNGYVASSNGFVSLLERDNL